MVCLSLLVTICSTKLHGNQECCRLVLVDRGLLTHTENGSCIQVQLKTWYTVVLLHFPLALHNEEHTGSQSTSSSQCMPPDFFLI